MAQIFCIIFHTVGSFRVSELRSPKRHLRNLLNMKNFSKPSTWPLSAALLLLLTVSVPSSASADGLAPELTELTQVQKLIPRPEQSALKPLKALPMLHRASRVDLSILEAHAKTLHEGEVHPLATNTDPSSALYMSLNTAVSNTLSAQGEQHWYFVHSADAGKLTFNLQVVNSASVDYDLHVFKLNLDTGMLEDEQVSAFGPQTSEQLSTLVSEDSYYFICVNAYQGFDAARPYQLAALYSPTSDAAEADDHPAQAKAYSVRFTANQTLDNAYDIDWIQFTAPKANNFTFTFSNVPSSSNYQVGIYDGNLNRLATLTKNSTVTYSMGAGVYYLRVASLDTAVPAAAYQLSVNTAATSAYLGWVDTDGGNAGFVNYGAGNFWRVYRSTILAGALTDINGDPVVNAPVTIVVNTPQTYVSTTTVSGVTDVGGNFGLSVNLPSAKGTYVYDNWSSYHYFDMATVSIRSSILQYNTSVYHFAYSTYKPH
ncbi:hypothetical protein SAMN05444354_107270 [Stigmatella aurantiaca]|uniref:Peptidase C-terminal archaeal/bacterial domain-containing protein n=2 Tax=Stigmatella aurantiaca TaxID=41 RepID=A0A1H7S1V4_STIAU|nr:hypothetical protein SAMN05444354_107270 [Stigmatella aurantiaca]